MKQLAGFFSGVALIAALASFADAASTNMTGMISDSMCGASHSKMIAMHKDAKMTDKDCTLACVKAGGKFVLVSDGKVYNILNQNLAELTKYAGQNVKINGEVNGNSISISKVSATK